LALGVLRTYKKGDFRLVLHTLGYKAQA